MRSVDATAGCNGEQKQTTIIAMSILASASPTTNLKSRARLINLHEQARFPGLRCHLSNELNCASTRRSTFSSFATLRLSAVPPPRHRSQLSFVNRLLPCSGHDGRPAPPTCHVFPPTDSLSALAGRLHQHSGSEQISIQLELSIEPLPNQLRLDIHCTAESGLSTSPRSGTFSEPISGSGPDLALQWPSSSSRNGSTGTSGADHQPDHDARAQLPRAG